MARQFKRECEGKVRYRTKTQAHSALTALLRDRGGRRSYMGIYRCRGCSNWHYGHRGGRKRVAH